MARTSSAQLLCAHLALPVDGAEEGWGRDHCSWRIIFDGRLKNRLYTRDFLERTARCDPIGQYAKALDGPPEKFGNLSRYLHADTTFYLPNDMLVKVDRMSMANGLEVRVPFLDPEFVTFCANLPASAKLYRGKIRKHILRESLRPDFSRDILERPKSGFNIPIDGWMRKKKMRDFIFDAIKLTRDEISCYLRIGEIEKILDEHAQRRANYGHALFSILFFALWCNHVKSFK